MRRSDSSPPIPPRFVAFARRYHPSTCGSLRRTPGATSTASGLVSRCPPPGGLYDGDDEASRVPGKPTRTHATRSDPGEVPASTAAETRHAPPCLPGALAPSGRLLAIFQAFRHFTMLIVLVVVGTLAVVGRVQAQQATASLERVEAGDGRCS